MDKVLPGSTMIWNWQEYTVPGQHERDVIGKEGEEIQHQKHETYQRTLLFYKGLGRNQGRGDWELYYGGNVGGTIHKAITRCAVQEVWGRNHEYIRQTGHGGDGHGWRRLLKGVMWKLHNETDLDCPQECVGDCKKVGRKNGAKEWPNGRTHNGVYYDVILEKGERSWGVRSYSDMTRGNV